MEEVPEALGGAAEERPQPPLSIGRVDVSFVVSVSRAGTALRRRDGKGGPGGGKNLFQLQSGLGNVARNANRGSFCDKECFHRFLKMYVSIIKILREKVAWSGVSSAASTLFTSKRGTCTR